MILTSAIREQQAGPEHMAFVLRSFRRCLAKLGHLSHAGAHAEQLERMIRGRVGRVVVATPMGHPDAFLGWAAALPDSLLFCYVPEHMRRLGIARQMVADLFPAGPVPLVYWTDTAERVREHGFPLVHDWQEFSRRSRMAERAYWQRRQTLLERTA